MDIIGVDYSITSPAICVGKARDSYSRLRLFGMSDVKKRIGTFCGNIFIEEKLSDDLFHTDIEKYEFISEEVMRHVKRRNTLVVIEGYSMASTGKVFNLAENVGVLKYRLHKAGVDYIVPSPKTVKKFATGSGNADKYDMVNAFNDASGWDIRAEFQDEGKNIKAPITDVVDAYWMFRYGAASS